MMERGTIEWSKDREITRKHGQDDVDDDATDAKPLSAGIEAARDMIDAYKSSLKEKRSMDRWMGSERVEGRK